MIFNNPFEEEFDRYDFFDMDDEDKKQESVRISCSRSKKTLKCYYCQV